VLLIVAIEKMHWKD